MKDKHKTLHYKNIIEENFCNKQQQPTIKKRLVQFILLSFCDEIFVNDEFHQRSLWPQL